MAGTSSAEDRPWQSYNTVYTNAKAGMDGVDKEKVQRVVYEMSKGSKYFENEQRKEAFIKQKIENLRAQCAKLTDDDMAHFQMIVDKRILELEASRDLSQIWLHTDMDAFYAAVETLENPSLKGKPLAVGSMSMICTANYEARKFGVRAAMPGFIARKLCPDLAFVPTNFEKYSYYSDLTRKVFQKYDPDFIAPSLDEAYLNITGSCNERGIASEEVCSDINKPNGQYILPNERKAVMTFISSLPIRKIGGIGKVTEHLLRDVLGINTCEEMLQKGSFLSALFSPCSTDFFLSVGLGLGSTDTPEHRHRKSISTERTFSATADETLLFRKLEDITETLSKDMQTGCLSGRTLTLKLKTASFESKLSRLSGVNKTDNSLGKRKLEPSWVDDQICSICGVELPPSFIEERQEHSDYHLAVMLQEEESMNNTGHLLLQERMVPKPSKGSGGAKKKQKSSPGKEKYIIPIDAFFNKSKKTLE